MAGSISFELVTPERRLAAMEASEVVVPGSEGDFTAMAEHAPIVTMLRPGILRASGGGETREFVVTSGFVEVNASSVSVMAEEAFPRETVTREEVEAVLERARAKLAEAPEDERDVGEKMVADLVHLIEMME
ncbi:MAG: ATP synthase F1 subunit epsilon [Alphaproteobacteria bacterium]|nr:MAG: ATP synthase F1 subunit epsilon [Alphaproteobacteria bacterium]